MLYILACGNAQWIDEEVEVIGVYESLESAQETAEVLDAIAEWIAIGDDEWQGEGAIQWWIVGKQLGITTEPSPWKFKEEGSEI